MTTKGGASQAEAGIGVGGWLGRLRLGGARQEGSLEWVALLLDGDGGGDAPVKTATLSGRAPSLDQSRLWRDVDYELDSSGVSSSTSNDYEIVERRGREARERASAVAPAPGQVGVLVLSGGALVGLEAAGHHGLWSELSAPTLASYLMGYARGHERARRERAGAGEWLARVQSARLAASPGLGLGQDLDLQAPGLSGVGLAMDGGPVHVAVFPA